MFYDRLLYYFTLEKNFVFQEQVYMCMIGWMDRCITQTFNNYVPKILIFFESGEKECVFLSK